MPPYGQLCYDPDITIVCLMSKPNRQPSFMISPAFLLPNQHTNTKYSTKKKTEQGVKGPGFGR